MNTRPRTAAELEHEMRIRLGDGDYQLTIQKRPEIGWHAVVHGQPETEVERPQTMADTVSAEMCQHYHLADK